MKPVPLFALRRRAAAHHGFLTAWGALLAAAVVLLGVLGAAFLPAAALALVMPPLVAWAAARPGPEPYDWPVWWYRLRIEVGARIEAHRRHPHGGAR